MKNAYLSTTSACAVAMMVVAGVRAHDHAVASETAIRALLSGDEFKVEHAKLVAMGSKAFESYRGILDDPAAQPFEIQRILSVITDVEADRKDFLDRAVGYTVHPDSKVRRHAAMLLSKIGGLRETPPLVALLSDKNEVVVNAAATTLAAIGGPREVVAMDAWLLGGSHADDKPLRTHVKTCRDGLAARLAKEPKAK